MLYKTNYSNGSNPRHIGVLQRPQYEWKNRGILLSLGHYRLYGSEFFVIFIVFWTV